VSNDWRAGFVSDIKVVDAATSCDTLDSTWSSASYDIEDLFVFPWYGFRGTYFYKDYQYYDTGDPKWRYDYTRIISATGGYTSDTDCTGKNCKRFTYLDPFPMV